LYLTWLHLCSEITYQYKYWSYLLTEISLCSYYLSKWYICEKWWDIRDSWYVYFGYLTSRSKMRTRYRSRNRPPTSTLASYASSWCLLSSIMVPAYFVHMFLHGTIESFGSKGVATWNQVVNRCHSLP
jgi:hypothetical protein